MKYKYSLIIILVIMLISNQWQINLLHKIMSQKNILSSVSSSEQSAKSTDRNNSNLPQDIQQLAKKLIATGIPPVYGAELQVSFDKAALAIPKLAPFEQDSRPNKLTGEILRRYIDIGQQTSCEFCCGARTMVFPDGRKACDCDHSAAMRGVAAYLLENYGDQMTDQQILSEVNKWKSAFFPGPTVNKYLTSNGLNSTNNLQQQEGGC